MPESNGSKSKSDWLEKTYAKSVAKAPERDYPFDTSDGALVEPLYAPEDMDGWDYLSRLSFPGEFPYTRGVQPTMYRGRLWTMLSLPPPAGPDGPLRSLRPPDADRIRLRSPDGYR